MTERYLISMPARSKLVRAMLNSFPSLTYTSETSVSDACRRLQRVRVSMSCLVATRSLVTEDSILFICRQYMAHLRGAGHGCDFQGKLL